MIRTINISFTHSGNFDFQKFRATIAISFFLIVGTSLTGMSQHTVVDSLTAHYQKEDDVENYTYACLDYFLLEPTEENLNVFEQYERKRWRAPSTDDDMLAYVILLCNKGFYLSRFGNLYEAVDAYEKAWTLFEGHQRSNFDIIEYCLKPLGNNYSMLGDYTSAENIIKRYLF